MFTIRTTILENLDDVRFLDGTSIKLNKNIAFFSNFTRYLKYNELPQNLL